MNGESVIAVARPPLAVTPDHWLARFITPDSELDGAPVLFTTIVFEAGHGALVSARLTITALGVCEARIAGQPISDELLTPGWTSYEWRLRVHRFDVTRLVGDGDELTLEIGNGWYRGRLGWTGESRIYGDEVAGFAELHLHYQDGYSQVIATGPDWRARASDSVADDLYDGQTIDARRRFASAANVGVRVVEYPLENLVGFATPPIRPLTGLAPEKVWRSPTGKLLIDFGQNVVGWIRVEVQGFEGSELVLRHAEVLENEELGVRPLRSAKATDRFILSGHRDVFEPTFTLHGFRYAEIEGWPGSDEDLERGLTAIVVGSDVEPTGTFHCSNELVNRLHENAVWSMRGNFVAVPTDCPQRDERLGWTGDIAAFAPAAAFIGDVRAFLGDWLRDLDLEQAHAGGLVGFVIPDVLKRIPPEPNFPAPDTAAIWSDAAVWVPWALWQAYGDASALAEQFPAMVAHARRVRSLLSPNGLWDQGFQFGDWLDPDAAPDQPWNSKADNGVVATACAYRTATLVSVAARALDREPERSEFAVMANELKAAFQRHYVDPAGRIVSDCTTVYALAICFGLLSEEQLRAAGDRLAELVRAAGAKISTGFAGTPFVCDALTVTGHLDVAYELLLQTACPSWLYPVSMGATTIWERWDSMLPDGRINPGEMTSFNHYALGAVVDWLHRVVGGLAPLEPGYRTILVAPRPGGGIEHVRTTLQTPHGRIVVAWRLVDGGLRLSVEVPPASTALVRVPGLAEQRLDQGHHELFAEDQTATQR